jgi:hypothetical protein
MNGWATPIKCLRSRMALKRASQIPLLHFNNPLELNWRTCKLRCRQGSELSNFRFKKIYFCQCLTFFSFFNTNTMHIKSIMNNCVAMISLKTLYPGGTRTRVCSSSGGCDVRCATPPGQKARILLHLI